jgi:serine/threonine protein kinase
MRRREIVIDEHHAMNYFSMILIGLHYLHSKDYIHMDLTPYNILLDILDGRVDIIYISGFALSYVN